MNIEHGLHDSLADKSVKYLSAVHKVRWQTGAYE
jgi:hypothetical protein